MRWKAIFFNEEGEEEPQQPCETYGLKTSATPRQVDEMTEFEKELIDSVRKVKFRKSTNDFQRLIKQDPSQKKCTFQPTKHPTCTRCQRNSMTNTLQAQSPKRKRNQMTT